MTDRFDEAGRGWFPSKTEQDVAVMQERIAAAGRQQVASITRSEQARAYRGQGPKPTTCEPCQDRSGFTCAPRCVRPCVCDHGKVVLGAPAPAQPPSEPVWDHAKSCWLVKTTEHWQVMVVPMIFNYRLVIGRPGNDESWEYGWCYFGTQEQSFTAAVVAATLFDPETEPEPAGYDKALVGGRQAVGSG